MCKLCGRKTSLCDFTVLSIKLESGIILKRYCDGLYEGLEGEIDCCDLYAAANYTVLEAKGVLDQVYKIDQMVSSRNQMIGPINKYKIAEFVYSSGELMVNVQHSIKNVSSDGCRLLHIDELLLYRVEELVFN